MCTDFGNRIPYSAYVEAFSQTRLRLIAPTTLPDFDPRDHIWPTETTPILRLADDGVELVQLRWGFTSERRKAGPVYNFRAEGRCFTHGRCLVPASHFFETNGTKSQKSKWRFTKAGEDWFCFAGFWRPPAFGGPESFTLLTTVAGPDVALIHDRQMVVLERTDWLAWLEMSRPDAELLKPLPAGSLRFEQER